MNSKALSLVAQNDSVIISLQRASTALAEAKTIQHTKKIIDVAAAAEIYAKRQQLGIEAVAVATSIKVEALRKLGEMLKATPKAKGASQRGYKVEPRSVETLAELGIDKKTSSLAQALANLTDAAFEEVREGNETVAKALAKVKADKEKPAAPAPAPTPEPEPVIPAEPEYTELDAAHDQITGLQDALAVATMGEVTEEDKAQAAVLISELRARIKTLEATLKAVTLSRDTYMNENAELRRQITRQRREIDKSTGLRTA